MLVKYRGGQSALSLMVGGIALRFAKNKEVLITAKQASELKQSEYMKQLIKKDMFTIDDLSGHNKADLKELAAAHNIEIPPKASEADIRNLLSGIDDDAGADDDDAAKEAAAKEAAAAKETADKRLADKTTTTDKG